MPVGQTTGVRGLQQYRMTEAFITALRQAGFISEVAGTLNGESLFKLVKELDTVAARNQNSRWRHEHTDAYCFARDFRYTRRSRRWLQAKALNSKLQYAYEEWLVFVQENLLVQPSIRNLPAEDINKLVNAPFNTVLSV